MAIENFIIKLYKESVTAMSGSDWKWPDKWTTERKQKFLDDALSYGESHELYEQCSIIRDVKKEINK